MLTYGPSPFFAGAKLLIICEISKFFPDFLINKGQFFIKLPFFHINIKHLIKKNQLSIVKNHRLCNPLAIQSEDEVAQYKFTTGLSV